MVDPEDLKVFVERDGPVHVVAEDGSPISYGTTARLDMADPTLDRTWIVENLVLSLLDELSRPSRSIPGHHIAAVRRTEPGYEVVVVDEDPDPGPTVSTRGAST